MRGRGPRSGLGHEGPRPRTPLHTFLLVDVPRAAVVLARPVGAPHAPHRWVHNALFAVPLFLDQLPAVLVDKHHGLLRRRVATLNHADPSTAETGSLHNVGVVAPLLHRRVRALPREQREHLRRVIFGHAQVARRDVCRFVEEEVDPRLCVEHAPRNVTVLTHERALFCFLVQNDDPMGVREQRDGAFVAHPQVQELVLETAVFEQLQHERALCRHGVVRRYDIGEQSSWGTRSCLLRLCVRDGGLYALGGVRDEIQHARDGLCDDTDETLTDTAQEAPGAVLLGALDRLHHDARQALPETNPKCLRTLRDALADALRSQRYRLASRPNVIVVKAEPGKARPETARYALREADGAEH
eukprot:PhM_4_TR15929/c0_g1_i1/m.54528